MAGDAMPKDKNQDIARAIEAFAAAARAKPDGAFGLISTANLAASKNMNLRAFELAREALDAAKPDSEAHVRARAVLGGLIPQYHIPMMNDARRNEA